MSRLAFTFREDRPWPSLRLTSSAIVGHTTTESAKIWVRVHAAGEYCLFVSEESFDRGLQPVEFQKGGFGQGWVQFAGKQDPTPGAVLRQEIGYGTDATHVFEVEGLKAGKEYFYGLFSADADREERWEVGRDRVHRFRTQAEGAEKIRFGIFSCHMPFQDRQVKNMHMWRFFREILETVDADFVLGCGDQVYTDGDDSVNIWSWLKSHKKEVLKLPVAEQRQAMLSWYRDIYRGYWGDAELRRVFRSFPTYMIWDDHEIMDGWGSYTDSELSNVLDTWYEWENKKKNLALAGRMFQAAKQVYQEYQHGHNPKTPNGVYDYSFQWDRLGIFVLDMRGKRDFKAPQARILGLPQKKRFEKWLESPKAASAKVLFVVAPVPVVHLKSFVSNYLDLPLLGIADDLRDGWEHESNWEERDWLLDQVFQISHQRKQTVVILSGDVHVGASFRLTRRAHPDAKVYQLTTSAITYCKSPGRLLRLAVANRGELEYRKKGTPSPTKRVQFHRLGKVFTANNFAMVGVNIPAQGEAELYWDLYGAGEESDELVRLNRLNLK
ncbi:MAG: alkaline phosphatase family protein [Planctomycetota bacterium]|nr:MAG: alkaline phosphatase family protein [Planctomycetota bacterium]